MNGSLQQPTVECRDLCHWYGAKQVLHGISWQVMPGRICGILGRNGAGKTTTINILNSFLTPASGQCLLFGEPAHQLSPQTKARIGYLIEGHVQYGFFNVDQIERFYAAFYARWNPAIYHHLIGKLDISRRQKIATMSCGQRSQVALGLILAQQPDLIVFDDYSLGLDPGYRRLFIDIIRDYAADGKRTIILTSHIIQDLEDLIDDCLIYQHGRILIDVPTGELRRDYRCYVFPTPDGCTGDSFDAEALTRLECNANESRLYGFMDTKAATDYLRRLGVEPYNIRERSISLEEAFIAITGKY